MKMKMVFALVILISALVIADRKTQATTDTAGTKQLPTQWPTQWTTRWPTQWTTAVPGLSLNGKMFTLARYSSAVTLYHPYFPISSWSLTRKTPLKRNGRPSPSTPPYPAAPYSAWTTAAPTRGVSVCLRYMIDYLDQRLSTIFTLSPSSRSLSLADNHPTSYQVKYYYSTIVELQPNIRFWSFNLMSPWTSVCLTMDSSKGLVQLFKGPFMSIRKVLPNQYDWSGEPVMEISGTAGQVKDVQVWNYPLRYKAVYNYMTEDPYWSSQGNVLTWSYMSYSLQGKSFLENSYESQARQPIRRGSRLKGAAMSKKFFAVEETKLDVKETV